MAFNIAIDGPAGAGKSTIAKKLAADLGYVYVDTGAMYRAMAYYFLQNHIDASDEQAIAAACPKVDVTIQYTGGEQQVILNKENVNGVIRKEEVGNMASATSALSSGSYKTGRIAEAACRKGKCDYGWKRYRYGCPSGCQCKKFISLQARKCGQSAALMS